MKQTETNVLVQNLSIPDRFPVTVIMERRPAKTSQWIDYVWNAVGITVGESQDHQGEARVDSIDGDIQLHYHSGFNVMLYIDECDSYYHNLMSPTPRCYIMLRQDDDQEEPVPFLVSLSFDEAHAYLEGDDTVFAVDIPAEMYRWIESFVLANYCPQQLKKRKRKNWKSGNTGH
jgi:hypothetical protein